MTRPKVKGKSLRYAPMTRAQSRSFEDMTLDGLRQLARAKSPEAVRTLLTLLRGKKVPAGVKRQVALDLIGLGYPETRAAAPPTGGGGGAGVTINILRLDQPNVRAVLEAATGGAGGGDEAVQAVWNAAGVHQDRRGEGDAGAEDPVLLHGEQRGGLAAGDGPDGGEVRQPLRDVPQRRGVLPVGAQEDREAGATGARDGDDA